MRMPSSRTNWVWGVATVCSRGRVLIWGKFGNLEAWLIPGTGFQTAEYAELVLLIVSTLPATECRHKRTPSNYVPLRYTTPPPTFKNTILRITIKIPFRRSFSFHFQPEGFFLLPAQEIWSEKASCNPWPSETKMLKQFRNLISLVRTRTSYAR